MTLKLAGDDAAQVLVQAWNAMGPYRSQAILVGGMAVFLYESHPEFRPISGMIPLPTIDIDVAVDNPLAITGVNSLAQRLVEAGFTRREVNREATSYTRFDFPIGETSDGERAEPYLEFLCPTDAVGMRDDEPQAGIRAHLSPYAWMLYIDPWSIDHPSGLRFQVPHPLTYFAQKILIRGTRPLEKRTKDLIDALYVMGGFRSSLGKIFSDRHRIASYHAEGREQIADACDQFRILFAGETSSGPIQIASGYSLNVLTPEMQRLASISRMIAQEILDAEAASRDT